ncbi:MAG TPA: MipA/OmpV family protein [Nevskiaceae bacterium]|nr:MipA/OmpV family protein [Nevskiaceae bacterium]
MRSRAEHCAVVAPVRLVGALVAALCVGGVPTADAQTPSPLPEWTYSAGIALRERFEQPIPKWQTELGIGFSWQPHYDGSAQYELIPAPSFDIRYSDRAFFSAGEGLGVNLLRGRNYRAGLAIVYNLGRKLSNDVQVTHQRRVGPTAEIKAFGEYVFFPVVLRLDIREAVAGGYDGYVGDLGLYLPVAGSREHHFVVFAGPSVTFANGGYMQSFFSVTPSQAAGTDLAPFSAHGGLEQVSFGVSATWFFHKRWLVNATGGVRRLMRDAADSPFTQRRTQGTVNFTLGYLFGGPKM